MFSAPKLLSTPKLVSTLIDFPALLSTSKFPYQLPSSFLDPNYAINSPTLLPTCKRPYRPVSTLIDSQMLLPTSQHCYKLPRLASALIGFKTHLSTPKCCYNCSHTLLSTCKRSYKPTNTLIDSQTLLVTSKCCYQLLSTCTL